jgi:hypothetical protein
MDASEVMWRARAAGRTMVQQGICAIRPPKWRRSLLAERLAGLPALNDVRHALAAERWDRAHQGLQLHFVARESRFVLTPRDRRSFAATLGASFPLARHDAIGRADRMLAGEHDLLGYRGLRFGGDWHYDPVNGRRAPRIFFEHVPYLDPKHGDHKVIWELNRHQQWLAYGRASWLSDDEKFRAGFITELRSWLDANPPLVGINWASALELALRSISWLWALHFFARSDGPPDAEPWTVDLLLALDRQLTHVEHNLSYYFSPNTHLLGEALALYVAGRALPELAASSTRAALGRRLLVAEAARQVAPDGFHCERSTHYHRYTLDFYTLALTVARITHDPIAAQFEDTVGRLAAAARVLADDFGYAPHLGDDDGGILLPIAGRSADDWRDSLATAAVLTGRSDLRVSEVPEETFWMTGPLALRRVAGTAFTTADTRGHAPTVTSTALADTGYYVSRSAAGDHLVFDGGAHGYKNAGHAHADALSLTLTLRGVPLLIDPGTACYTVDAVLRDRFRTTAAHNTLLLDDTPQSHGAGPFHWSRTADAVTHRWRTAIAFDYVDASHSGYAPVVHRRRVLNMHGAFVLVLDAVEGTGVHKAAVHWHVGHAWTAEARSRSVTFRAGRSDVGLVVAGGRIDLFAADAATGLGWHSPVYGRVESTTTVRIAHEGEAPFAIATAFDLDPLQPIECVEWLRVSAAPGSIAHSHALKIVRGRFTDYACFVEAAPGAAHPFWRIADFETDAHMMFCRTSSDGDVTSVAIVDGSFVRGTGGCSLDVALGRVVSAVHLDESTIRTFTPCAVLPAS